MLTPYRDVLARPGALRFTLAGLIARLPTPMVGLGIVLMVSALYGSYGVAGRVSAVFVVVQAVCSPQLSRLVDRYGQARVMRPALAVACLGLTALVVAAVRHAPEPVLYLTAALAGGYWLLAQRGTEPPATGRPSRSTAEPMLSGALLVLLVIFLAAGVVFGGIDVAVVAFTADRGAPGSAGLVLAAVALGSLIAALGYGARQWASPLWLRLVGGTALLAAGTAALLAVGSVPLLAVVGFLAGFAIAPTIVNGNSFVQLIAPPRRMTEGFTWLGAAIGIGVSLGASVSGTMIDAHGPRGGFVVVAAAASAALLVGLAAAPVLRRAGERRPTLDGRAA